MELYGCFVRERFNYEPYSCFNRPTCSYLRSLFLPKCYDFRASNRHDCFCLAILLTSLRTAVSELAYLVKLYAFHRPF